MLNTKAWLVEPSFLIFIIFRNIFSYGFDFIIGHKRALTAHRV